MGNFKVIGKSYSGNPITDVVVPVRKQRVLPIVPRKQYLDETIVTSTVDKDGTNEQVFMNSNGNRSYGLDINGTDSLAKRFYPNGMIREYKTFKPGTPEFEEIAKKSKKYEVPLVGYEEASANLEEVKNQMKQFQEGGEVPSNDQQQQLFVSIITDMANVLGVEPSQELAEAVMTAFENNDDSQGLITLFTQIKDKRMSETGLFREGGKMNAFINKFKCGGKANKKTSKKQEGGEVETTTNYDHTKGPDLKRRQARKIAEVNKGADRKDFRKGMQNAKRHFDNQGLKGKEKRDAAKRLVAGVETMDKKIVAPKASFEHTPEITGPGWRDKQGIVSTGDVIENGTKTRFVPVVKQVPVKPQPEVYGPAYVDDDRKTDAWYQYQYERQLFDRANHNYRPNQDSAAYQHWMWKDFNDAYDAQTGQAKRDFRMRVPSQDELLQFMDAGEFKHGALPMSKQRQMEYGVDHGARNWYFDDDSRYAVDAAAQNSGIPHTSDLYDGVADVMATTLFSAFQPEIKVANIPGRTANMDDMAQMYGYRRVNNSAPQFTGRSQNHHIGEGFKSGSTRTIDGKQTTGRIGSFESSGGRARWAEGPFKGRFAKNSSTGMSDEFIKYMEGAKGNPSYQWYAPGFNKGGKL